MVMPVIDEAVQRLKSTTKRWRAGVITGRVAVERIRDLRRVLGRRDGVMGATHRRFSREDSLAYIDEVFEDYLAYGDLGREDIFGARVLELGPGDNLGVALRFLARGADRVVGTDRFLPIRDPTQEREIYSALVARLPPEERRRVAPVAERGTGAFEEVGLALLAETPIEDAPAILGAAQFDLIVSRAVLEHVHDLERAFEAMDQLLVGGGLMIHKVDLRDHGLFTDGGHNSLTFLTLSDRVYRWMGEESAGLPNRVPIGWYIDEMAGRGYEASYMITHVAGVEEELLPPVPLADQAELIGRVKGGIDAIRPRLAPAFAALADEELAVAGFVLAARKPGAAE